MNLKRPPPRFTNLLLSLLVLLSFSLSAIRSEANTSGSDGDLAELEELYAIEEEEERKGETAAHGKPSEAETLRRAQKVVLELGNENAKGIVDGNEFVLVLGYAPWCVRSAELMPRFAEAATSLRETGSPVLTAKVDAERHANAASVLGIKGFPTLLLFVNGSAQSYTGGYTRDEIIIWVRKKTGAPIIRLQSVTAAEEHLTRHQIFIVGLFENFEGPQYEEFVKAAIADNEIQFVEVNDINVAKILFPDIRNKKHFLGLVKSEPERFVTFEEAFKEEEILKFINYNKFPLVTTLTELNSARVYSSQIKLQVFVFAQTDNIKHFLLPLQDVAGKYKTKIMFIYVDSKEDGLAKPFLTLFGLESEKPIVTAFDNRIGSKYLLESDFTPSNIDAFCASLLNGTLSPYFKSEPVPDDKTQKGIVQKVVGRTFSAMVLDSSENIFLEVYTPWCIDCEATSKQTEALAKHFKNLDNLLFARIDAFLNEHPKLQIDNYPTLLFYPSEDKSNPIKLSKKSSLKELIALLEAYVKSYVDRNSSREQNCKEVPTIKEEL